MKLKSIVCFLIVAFITILTAGMTNAAETRTKTVIYDEKGNVIGYEETVKMDTKKSDDTINSTGSSKAFNPDRAYEEGELIAINTPEGFSSGIRSLGFHIIETIKISGTKMVVHRIRIPDGIKVSKAIRQLEGRYPEALIDANNQFDHSVTQ